MLTQWNLLQNNLWQCDQPIFSNAKIKLLVNCQCDDSALKLRLMMKLPKKVACFFNS
jgi:hypothetical protein